MDWVTILVSLRAKDNRKALERTTLMLGNLETVAVILRHRTYQIRSDTLTEGLVERDSYIFVITQ